MPLIPQLIIDLAAIQANYRLLANKARPAKTAAAVKANAYGVDVAPVARALYDAGCRTFFTAYGEEALELRSVLADVTVAPFHGLAEDEYEEAASHRITPV